MPLRPPVEQMLVSHVEKSSITSGAHGPPLDELLLAVVPAPVPLLAVALLVVCDPPVPCIPPVPLVVVALELEAPPDPDDMRLTQTESTHVRPERHRLPVAHAHFS
jgi:hypothetical protein